MGSLFDGLEEFGIDKLEGMDLFEDPAIEAEKKKEEKRIKPEDLLYNRTIQCPVCATVFEARTIKSGAAKLEDTSLNLRPIYSRIDPICYDVILCEVCGYAALNRNFKKISDRQANLIKEKISMKFVGKKYPQVYDYEIALERYKFALYSDVAMGRTDVNKAYLCLKITWILDSMIEIETDEEKIKAYRASKDIFASNACKGFKKSYDMLTFPVFGMNEPTYHYLLGALSYETGNLKETGYWLGRVLLSTSGHRRIKDKARELKNKIDDEKAAKG